MTSTEICNFTDAEIGTLITSLPLTPRATQTPAELLATYAQDDGLNTAFFVVTLLELVLGTSGNILVIVTVLVNKKLHKVQYLFVVNLAVADLTVSACVNAVNLANIRSHGMYLLAGSPWCPIVGLLCTLGCETSLYSLAAIALNRYVSICHRLTYPTIYSRRTIPVLVALTWLVGVAGEVISWAWNEYEYEHRIVPQLFTCMSSLYMQSITLGLAIVFGAVGYFCPIAIIIYCYLRIWLYAQASKKALRETSGDGASRPGALTDTNKRLLRTLLTLVVAVVVLLSPFYIIFIFRLAVSREVLVATFSMVHFNSCINCIVYALTNRDFRRGYRDVLGRYRLTSSSVACRLHRKKSIVYSVTGANGVLKAR